MNRSDVILCGYPDVKTLELTNPSMTMNRVVCGLEPLILCKRDAYEARSVDQAVKPQRFLGLGFDSRFTTEEISKVYPVQ